MDNIDSGLLKYIEEVTQSPLENQLEFFNENLDTHPKEIISIVRNLSEETVRYLYYLISGSNEIPGPYWCLIFISNNPDDFLTECRKCKEKGKPYPKNPQLMWEANQALKQYVPKTFISEANSVKRIGNSATHNKKELADLDLSREAKKCLDSYDYILGVVNSVITQNKPEPKPEYTEPKPEYTEPPATTSVQEPESKTTADPADFDVKSWFAGVQAELAKERAKTQEDYDLEDEEN